MKSLFLAIIIVFIPIVANAECWWNGYRVECRQEYWREWQHAPREWHRDEGKYWWYDRRREYCEHHPWECR